MKRSIGLGIFIWLLAISVVGLLGCKPRIELQYETQNFEKGFENYTPQKENCTYLKFSYPEFTGGPDPEGLKKINAEIQNFLLAPVGEKKPSDLEAFARDFFSDFQKFKKDFPKAPQTWFVEKTVEVLVKKPTLLSLSFEGFEYLGGAHPLGNQQLLSLNPSTGTRYTLADLLKPNYEAELNALGEKIFRKVREIPEGQGLAQAGFDFKGNQFQLNDNFAAGPDGLIFYFNSYEITSYAGGPTEVVIPYSELANLIRPDGPLSGIKRKPL